VSLREDSFVELFSESAGRAVVSITPGREAEFAALAESRGVPARALGTTGGDAYVIDGAFEIPVDELRSAWTAPLPALFG
jgi:phosphoribosylformylglycinamidine synthase